MLKEYRFEKFMNLVTGRLNKPIIDKKIYYRVNEHWVNAVVYQLLYDRAISKGYRCTEDNTEHRIYENGKYYKAEEFEYEIVLSKKGI